MIYYGLYQHLNNENHRFSHKTRKKKEDEKKERTKNFALESHEKEEEEEEQINLNGILENGTIVLVRLVELLPI